MSKQRRPPERETRTEGQRERPAGSTLDEEVSVGQAALRGGPTPSADLGGAALTSSPVADLAGRVALALRFPPRDAAEVERLVSVVERSGLSSDRRAALVERLQGDLALAGRVSEALRDVLGRDDPAERSALIGALERAASTDGGARTPEQVVAEVVAAQTGHAAGDVEALCRALSAWIAWWEEEEEEALPGDYAAEESGS